MKLPKSIVVVTESRGTILSTEFLNRSRKSIKDFTRKRKLTFMNYFQIILNFMNKALQLEIDNFFEVGGLLGRVSQQAFSKARLKIKWEAFRELFDLTVKLAQDIPDAFDRHKGFRILAVDGTEIFLEASPSLVEHFGKKPRRDNCKAKVSVVCEVFSGYLLDADIGHYAKGERLFAAEHLERLSGWLTPKDLIIFDRGYPSAELISLLEEAGVKYLMRVRRKFNVDIDASKSSDFYVKLPHAGRELKVRALKFLLDTGETETLVTNLARNQFSLAEFKDLYFMRWPVEGKYDTVKNKLKIEAMSGRSVDVVKQDFFSTMYLANVVACAKAESDELIRGQGEGKANTYTYQTNESQLIAKLRNKLTLCLLLDDDRARDKLLTSVIESASRSKVPIRPGRSSPRNKKVKPSLKRRPKSPL